MQPNEISEKTKQEIRLKGLRECLFNLFNVLGITVAPVMPFYVFNLDGSISLLYSLTYGKHGVHRSPKVSAHILEDSASWPQIAAEIVLADVEHIVRQHLKEAAEIKPAFTIV